MFVETEVTYAGADLFNWRVVVDGALRARGTALTKESATKRAAFYAGQAREVRPVFECLECGKKFKTAKAAEKASSEGCPKCGGVDIDLAAEAAA